MSAFNICRCGDFRHQHEQPQGGACELCPEQGGMNGVPCQRFRLAERVTWVPVRHTTVPAP